MGQGYNCCRHDLSGPSALHGTASFTSEQDRTHSNGLHRHNSEIDYGAVVDLCSAQDVVCGTPLLDHRDPLHHYGGIRTGVLDVDGNGKIECDDLHDACFMNFPVEAAPHPVMHSEDFQDLQQRNQTILALQDLSLTAERDPQVLQEEVRNIAAHSGLSLNELRQLAEELYGPEDRICQVVTADYLVQSALKDADSQIDSAKMPGGRVTRK
eukprot:gnl/MRDRNA2_/MRDRNA2_61189_c0_seq1.p1 gnl/MRDRNA2_/MRDRNA2_61189_c0~~gnl/MRDRNA2_/MRDRNA2_61189_c0_seq1.p1  ORF type:complete len:211 (-),score=35.57 gnl/MRDRNA2_/MRDRNA2_61189_c0_seq1:317-949(-)